MKVRETSTSSVHAMIKYPYIKQEVFENDDLMACRTILWLEYLALEAFVNISEGISKF